MGRQRALYLSSSIGLGHVTRDLAIAAELRRLAPELEILWLAAPPRRTLFVQPARTYSRRRRSGAERVGSPSGA